MHNAHSCSAERTTEREREEQGMILSRMWLKIARTGGRSPPAHFFAQFFAHFFAHIIAFFGTFLCISLHALGAPSSCTFFAHFLHFFAHFIAHIFARLGVSSSCTFLLSSAHFSHLLHISFHISLYALSSCTFPLLLLCTFRVHNTLNSEHLSALQIADICPNPLLLAGLLSDRRSLGAWLVGSGPLLIIVVF